MGLFSSIANIFGGNKIKKASRQAASAQVAGLNQGIDTLQARQNQNDVNFDNAIAGFQPYQQGGAEASSAIEALLGLNGASAQGAALGQLQSSPLFSSLFGNGQEAVLQSASATGGLRGGNTQRSLADFGSDLFGQIIQQQLQNLGGVADRGFNAAGSILGGRTNQASLGNANAGNIANLQAGVGDAQAGGIIGAAKGSLMKYGGVADLGSQVFSKIQQAFGAPPSGGGVTFPTGGNGMPTMGGFGAGPKLF